MPPKDSPITFEYQTPYDVFLCYNSEDEDLIWDVYDRLKDQGLCPWIDKEDSVPGRVWYEDWKEVIEQIGAVAVFVGDSGLGPWQRREVGAFLKQSVRRELPVVPVLLSNAPSEPDLSLFLDDCNWVDFRQSRPDPFGRLMFGITGEKPESKTLPKPTGLKSGAPDPRVRLPENYVDRAGAQHTITSSLQVEQNTIAFQEARKDYLDRLRSHFVNFDLTGIALTGSEQTINQPKRVEEIFVMPFLRREPHQAENQAQSIHEISGQDLFKFSKGEKPTRILLLGAPGSGKTALISYCALKSSEPARTSDKTVQSEDIGWLPIVIRMRELSFHDSSILNFIRDFAEKKLSCPALPQGFFEHWLEEGRAVILVDGLDEVAKEKASKITEIRSFIEGKYAKNHAIITSRPVGNPGQHFRLEDFPRYQIQPLHRGLIHIFIKLWYKNSGLEKAEADKHEANLQKALSDNERVSLLAQNPLLLTIILLIHRDQAQLPRERCDLYHCAINTLLHSWEEVKFPNDQKVLDYISSPDDLRWLMSRLACWMHTKGAASDQGELLVHRDDLLQQLSQYIQEAKQIRYGQAKREAERFLDQVVGDRAGLLSNQGNGYYTFVHRTFQEYLAAEDLCNRMEERFEPLLYEIQAHLHKAHWREVILLLVAQLSREKAAQLIRAILQKNSEHERWLYRDLLLAGCCLAEKPKGLGQAEEEVKMVTDILT
jgi:predicted NACHT family NTPase